MSNIWTANISGYTVYRIHKCSVIDKLHAGNGFGEMSEKVILAQWSIHGVIILQEDIFVHNYDRVVIEMEKEDLWGFRRLAFNVLL